MSNFILLIYSFESLSGNPNSPNHQSPTCNLRQTNAKTLVINRKLVGEVQLNFCVETPNSSPTHHLRKLGRVAKRVWQPELGGERGGVKRRDSVLHTSMQVIKLKTTQFPYIHTYIYMQIISHTVLDNVCSSSVRWLMLEKHLST